MNSDDLTFFSRVAAAGSIAAAANAVGCDASTISRRITNVEKSFGTRLFVRSGRGLSVSAEGAVLLKYAQQISGLLHEAKSAISSLQGNGPPQIHIVAQPTIAKILFGPLYHAVREAFPRSEIRFSEALSDKIQNDLRSSHADLAVMYRPEFPGNLSYEPLLFEQLYLITPPDFALRPEHLKTAAFAEVPLIAKSSHHGVRVMTEEICARLGCEPRIVLQNDSSIDVTVELIATRCGCGIMPLAAAHTAIREGRVQAHSLADWSFERCVSLVVGRSDISSSDLWILNGTIRRVVERLLATGAWPGARPATDAGKGSALSYVQPME